MEDNVENLAPDREFSDNLNDRTKDKEDRTMQGGKTEYHEAFDGQQTHDFWNNTGYQYKNAREYAQVLQAWIWQYRFFSAMNAFHCHLVSSMPLQHQSQNVGPVPGVATQQNFGNMQGNVPHAPIRERLIEPQDRTQNNTGERYKVPMLWRRIVAECLDFILLFYIKILVTVAVLRQMGYMNENFLDLDDQFPLLENIENLDYEKMLGFTSELIALEVVNRVMITLVETLCLRHGYAGVIGGATPGKKIMHLKVISYNSITDLRNGHILVIGERDPGFFNALVRSVIKNFSLAFFFPACFTVFFFRFNRAAYDILSNTVVVEVERQPN